MRSGFFGLVILLAAPGLTLAQSAPPAAPKVVESQQLPAAVPPKPAAAEAPPPAGTQLWNDQYTTCDDPYAAPAFKKHLPDGCFWVSADYLMWWMRGQQTPPLVTTGPATVPPNQFGAIGGPGTVTLFGGNEIDYGLTNGLRVSAGLQGEDHAAALEGSAFLLERKGASFRAASDAAGNPIIARPFTDVVNGVPTRLLVSGPNAFSGGIAVSTTNRFWGAEAHVSKASFGLVGDCSNFEFDLLAGFRFLSLTERLRVAQDSVILPGGNSGFNGAVLLAPTEVRVADLLDTTNQFYGTQLGAAGEYQLGRFFVYGCGKVALGVVYEVANNIGTTTAIPPGGTPTTVPGGLFALASNFGRRTHTTFAAVPEGELNVGYQVTCNLRLYVGYSAIYWNTVARPGDQATTQINVTQLPTSRAFGPPVGPLLPAPAINHSDFWAHGVNFGFALHF